MKYLIFIVLFASYYNNSAQITLSCTHDSASTYNIFGTYAEMNQLLMIKFEISGERYVKVNRCGKVIEIYNLNHSLVKTISLTGVTLANGVVGDILYLSETLFDTDPAIEFMYTVGGGNYYITNIYKENGSLIFSDTGSVMVYPNYEMQQYPIYNTSQGTIMILSYLNGQAKVFSLAGTLSANIEQANGQLMQQSGTFSNLYPKPQQWLCNLTIRVTQKRNGGRANFV